MAEAKELGFELAHIGINQADSEEAGRTVETLCALFGFESREADTSFFVNEQFEVMKLPYLGRLGHVAIATCDVEGAVAYLREKGIGFDESTARRGADGRLRLIYFDRDIAGFRFHLTQKG